MEDYTILLQKSKDDSPMKDVLVDFGIAVEKVPFQSGGEIKELETTTPRTEHGERVHFPNKLWFSAYDMEVNFICVGERDGIVAKYNRFTDYLMGGDNQGTELKIFVPHIGIGRRKVLTKSISDFALIHSDSDSCLTFKVTFRVYDPVTHVAIGTNNNLPSLMIV